MTTRFEWLNAHRWIRRWTDVQNDFPSNGIRVTDKSNLFIDTASGTQISVQITYDFPDEIEAGTASWYEMTTFAGNTENTVTLTDYGPSGVKLVSGGSGDKAYLVG